MENNQPLTNPIPKARPKRPTLILSGVVVLLGTVGFFGWRALTNKNQTPQHQTAPVTRGTIISSVSASGQITGSNLVTVVTQATGTVQAVFVKEGDMVAIGQKLAELALDSASQQRKSAAWSSYLGAQKALKLAENETYALQVDLMNKAKAFQDVKDTTSYASEEERLQFHTAESAWRTAETKYQNQGAAIDQARIALENARLAYQQVSPTITAPTAGTVISLPIVPEMVLGDQTNTASTSQTQKIAVVELLNPPLATFSLSEIDVSKVKPGLKVTVTIDSLPDKTFTGEVVSVDRTGSTTSGVTSYPTNVRFDTTIPGASPNMAATANIIIATKTSALLVPSAAIVTSNGQTMVRVLRNGGSLETLVEIGLISDTQTEILAGLTEGAEVITATVISTTDSSQTGSSPFGGLGGGMFMRSTPSGGQRRD